MSVLLIKRTLADKRNASTLFPRHALEPKPHPNQQYLEVAADDIDAVFDAVWSPQSSRHLMPPSAAVVVAAAEPTASPRLKNTDVALSLQVEFDKENVSTLFPRHASSYINSPMPPHPNQQYLEVAADDIDAVFDAVCSPQSSSHLMSPSAAVVVVAAAAPTASPRLNDTDAALSLQVEFEKENVSTLFPRHASSYINSPMQPHPSQYLTVAADDIDAVWSPLSSRHLMQPSAVVAAAAAPTASPRLKKADAALSLRMKQELKRQCAKLQLLRQASSDAKQAARQADSRANAIAEAALKQERFVYSLACSIRKSYDDDAILMLTQHFESHEQNRRGIRGVWNEAEKVECTWRGPTNMEGTNKLIPSVQMEHVFQRQVSKLLSLRKSASEVTLYARDVEAKATALLGRTLKKECLVHRYVLAMAKISYKDNNLALVQHSDTEKNATTALGDAHYERFHTKNEIRKWSQLTAFQQKSKPAVF